jgi:Lon protease-like protein
MSDSSPAIEFSGTVKLFPLPNLVMFPHVVQGLHIFEPRYRQLMADALADDKLMAVVQLKPGCEDECEKAPPIETMACLGRVTWHVQLPDGGYNLRLRGISRVRILEETPNDRLYRTARVELVPDCWTASPAELQALREGLAAEVLNQFDEDGASRKQLEELFQGNLLLGQVCDLLAYALPLGPETKQALLNEEWADRRAAAMIAALRTATARANRKFPPEFSAN